MITLAANRTFNWQTSKPLKFRSVPEAEVNPGILKGS